MPKVELEQIPAISQVTVAEAAEYENVSEFEIRRRMDSDELTWAFAPRPPGKTRGPKMVRVIDGRTMSQAAQERWKKDGLVEAHERLLEKIEQEAETAEEGADSKPEAKDSGSGHPKARATPKAQMALFDAKLPPDRAMLEIPEWAASQVRERLGLVREHVNGDYAKLGFSTKRQLLERRAVEHGISGRHLQRLTRKFRATITPENPKGDARVLMDTPPGPARGSHRVLEDWMVAYLNSYFFDNLTASQAYDALVVEIEAKKKANLRHLYPTPSRATVYRLYRSFSPLTVARREGSAALKAACGFISRRWDCGAGEMWCTDEWLADFFVYDEDNRQNVDRPQIVSLMDARSRYVLDFEMTLNYSHETVLDLMERVVRKHGRPDYFYSDKGGWFRGRLGRNFRVIPNEKIFGPAASILEQLGVSRRGPGDEKNPRGNPIERKHRDYHELARWFSTYCGSNTDERPERVAEQRAQHTDFVAGRATCTGLITLGEARRKFGELVEKRNHTPSRANGLHGLSPAAAYQQFATDVDRERRRVDEGDLLLAFAESYSLTVRQGGVIEVGTIRYYHPLLCDARIRRRYVRRARHDDSFIVVLPAYKGDDTIIAPRMQSVGTHDPESLARQQAMLKAVRKVAERVGALPEPSTAETRGKRQETSFSPPEPAVSMEWDRATAGPTPQRAWSSETTEGFAEETETAAAPVPRLHDLAPMTVEEQ